MSTIRPGLPPIVPPGPAARPAEAARVAAQRAFFEIASGRAVPPAAAPPPVQPAAASRPAAAPAASAPIASAASQEPSAKPLRPGSLLDIRV